MIPFLALSNGCGRWGLNMIDGHTQLVGVIGWPVAHSLSPVMHNAAFDVLGLNWRYVPLPVRPGQVEAAVRGLVALDFRGANVTVPHKQVVMSMVDSFAPNAKELGAVNTLVIERRDDGSAVIGGYNTDEQGFLGALGDGGFEPQKGQVAVVVGAGGAARAVVSGLLQSGIREITVLNRSLGRGHALVLDLTRHSEYASRLCALPLTPDSLLESASEAALVVNATPVGMWPDVDACIWPDRVPVPAHLTVFDLVYNPPATRLVQLARGAGARAIGGLEMLVKQGALSFEMWTGELAPVETMRAACERALRR
jgi:shikimate dehydrogenase